MKHLVKSVILVALGTCVCVTSSCESRKEARVGAQTMSEQGRPIISSSGYDITPLTPARVKELSKDLDPEQIHVACDSGTERAFTGKYWKNKEPGIYTCIVCGLPLFRSNTKFESGTGWPSFYDPFDADHVQKIEDRSHGMVRTEIRCARSGSHLGHVFRDGPRPTGLRYCLNSAAMNFIKEGAPLPPESQPVKSATTAKKPDGAGEPKKN